MLKSCPFWKATQIMEFKKCHTLQPISTIHLKVDTSVRKIINLHSIGIIVMQSKETRVITYTCRHSRGYLIPNSSWHNWIIEIKRQLDNICRCRWSPLFFFLLFITMIPIDCKIINFSLHLFVCFFEITIIIFWRTPNKVFVENPLASTLRIHSLSAHYAVL